MIKLIKGVFFMSKTAKKNFVLMIILVLFVFGCSQSAIPDSVNKLVRSLKKHGIKYKEKQTYDSKKLKLTNLDEAVILKNDDLWIEIFKSTDEIIFNAFAKAGNAMGEMGSAMPSPFSPQVYNHKPFIILITKEPNKGDVKKALDKIFPDS